MATPRRIFRIYHALGADAETVRDFMLAKGEPVSTTVKNLCDKDADKLLRKWGDEMEEIAGVLDGTHEDPYILEATQTFYWASLYAIVKGLGWDDIGFDEGRRTAPTCGVDNLDELRSNVQRLVGMGPEVAKPSKLFLLWNVADAIYRRQTPAADRWTLEQIMDILLLWKLHRVCDACSVHH
jgi:phosphoribosyl-ATP pyrophosphohydrolase